MRVGADILSARGAELGPAEMSDLDDFSSLIGNIYDASLDPSLWPAAFEHAGRFVRCSSAHLFAQDSVHNRRELFGHLRVSATFDRSTMNQWRPIR